MRAMKKLLPVPALLLLIVAFCAAGSSPLATQTAQVGPYQVLLSFYSLPRAGQELNMTIEPSHAGTQLQFLQVILKPAPSTDANTIGVNITPDADTRGVYDISATPPIRGLWYLHLTVKGSAGSVVGDIPIDVQGPPVIPTWLGWLIGLLPLPLLVAFIWMQVGWRKAKREGVRQEMLERPSF